MLADRFPYSLISEKRDGMSYMNCPRCGLSVELRSDQTTWENCPRCLGQAGISVPIYVSPRLPAIEPVRSLAPVGGGLEP